MLCVSFISFAVLFCLFSAPREGAACRGFEFECIAENIVASPVNGSGCIPLRDYCDSAFQCTNGGDECDCSESKRIYHWFFLYVCMYLMNNSVYVWTKWSEGAKMLLLVICLLPLSSSSPYFFLCMSVCLSVCLSLSLSLSHTPPFVSSLPVLSFTLLLSSSSSPFSPSHLSLLALSFFFCLLSITCAHTVSRITGGHVWWHDKHHLCCRGNAHPHRLLAPELAPTSQRPPLPGHLSGWGWDTDHYPGNSVWWGRVQLWSVYPTILLCFWGPSYSQCNQWYVHVL